MLAPSAGHTFYLNSENGKVRYEDFLMKEFMPQMEKKYRVEGTRATRGITGVSMGGYGALRSGVQVSRRVRRCQRADAGADHRSAQGSQRRRRRAVRASLLGDVFGSPFNRTYFDRNNVFYFARTDSAASLKRMKIYFDVGNNDDYGFEQGAQAAGQAAELARHPARVSHLSRRARCRNSSSATSAMSCSFSGTPSGQGPDRAA